MEAEMEEVGESTPLIEAVPESMEAEAPPAIQETVMTSVPEKEEDEWSGSYTWHINNFTSSPERRFSERFEVATYYWRLLIFPHGNKSTNQLSAYLDAPEAPLTPPQMSPRASFKLHILNQLDTTKRISKEAAHTFTQGEADWGFTSFFSLDELLNPANGWILNDTVILKVDVRVERDERYNFDTRKETGAVGLKNQGATCYMNSLLQYLYHLPFFRTAVYHMPTMENDEASKSLPLALQSLFYKLQYSKTHVSTKDLTKSFGWGTYDAFMQHDVQELNRVLCEKLEEKMKGTKVERVITELFEGHTINFIECIHVDYKSSRKESFMDLQLDVKNCKNVYDSFERYCEVEMMDGPNQYKAEGHGLQDAKKGVLFGNLPPVLQLQLKRFEYDFHRDTMVKINDRYEFPELLDLDFKDRKIFAPEADQSVRNLYRLHSVLVHSGGVHGGHYYAFIRPDGQKWIKFDDDRVELSDNRRAMEEQYGGEDDGAPPAAGYPHPPVRYAKYSNAYMLVYIRESDWARIMSQTTQDDIAEHLRERFQQEQIEKEARQKMKQEAHLYCTLKLATDKDLMEQGSAPTQYLDLFNHDRLPAEHVFRVKKNMRFEQFKADVAAALGVPVAAQRYWIWTNRGNNGSLRPNRPLTPKEEQDSLMELREHRDQSTRSSAKQSLMDIKLLLEVPQRFNRERGAFEVALSAPLPDRKNQLLLFLKLYDPATEQLRYVGRIFAAKQSMIKELYPLLRLSCGLPEAADIEVYGETKFESALPLTLLEPKVMLNAPAAGVEDGDILVIQCKLGASEAGECRFPSADKFLDYMRNRRIVTFKRLEDPKEPGIALELLQDMDYDAVTAALAAKIGLEDHDRIRLTQHNAYSHQPQKHPMKYRGVGVSKLEQMLVHAQHVNDVLYYETLDMPLGELEKLKIIKITLYNEKAEPAGEHVLRLPLDRYVGDLLQELQRQLGQAYEGKTFRLLEVYNGRIYKVCDDSCGVDHLNSGYWQLRAEVVPEDEVALAQAGDQAQDRVIQVCHFSQEKDSTSHSTFGDPFLMRIRDNESVAEIKTRIQAKLGVSGEEFSKWRFAYCPQKSHHPEYLEDHDQPGQRFARTQNNSLATDTNNYLGLQHEDKAPRRTTNNNRLTYEKPVKIYS